MKERGFIMVLALAWLGGCASITHGPRLELPDRGFQPAPGSVQILSRRVELRRCLGPKEKGSPEIPHCVYAPLQVAITGASAGESKPGVCPVELSRQFTLAFALAKWNQATKRWDDFTEMCELRASGEQRSGNTRVCTATISPRLKDTSFGLGASTAVSTDPAQTATPAPDLTKPLEMGEATRQALRDVPREGSLECPDQAGSCAVPPRLKTQYPGFACTNNDAQRVVNIDLVLNDPHFGAGESYQLWLWNHDPKGAFPSAIYPQELKAVNSIAWLSWLIGLVGVFGFVVIGGFL